MKSTTLSIQVFKYSSIHVFKYSIFKYSSIQVFKYSSIQVLKFRVYKLVTHYRHIVNNVKSRDPIGSKNIFTEITEIFYHPSSMNFTPSTSLTDI